MFPLNNVKVAIYDAEGALVEEGAAEANPNAISWSYTVTTPNENFIGSVIRHQLSTFLKTKEHWK